MDITFDDWISTVCSAWTGHRIFAEWLVNETKPKIIVELGVDYGYSTYVWNNALEKENNGRVYGVDLFLGDAHTSFRSNHEYVLKNIADHNLKRMEIIRGDFKDISNLWWRPVDILHIDGFHTYEAVKSDFDSWSRFVKEDGIILFHDVAIQNFGIKDFFRQLPDVEHERLYFVHSAGLGIYTKNKVLAKKILDSFPNVYDFKARPF
jgi:hypothetical protein